MPTKKYLESPAHAAECFRLAVPLMAKQPARPHPLSYAVWYEHVSGRNASLSAEIDQLMAGGASIDEETTQRLYQKHVLDRDGQAAQKLADGVRSMLSDAGDSAREADRQSATFDAALTRWEHAVEAGEAADPARRQLIRQDTQVMRDAVQSLQSSMARTLHEVDALQRELARVNDAALRDSLTGLANRSAFDLRLAEQLAASAPGCLLAADIDHFKKVNDTYGHLFGDQVLRAVAQAIRSCLAPTHLPARTGGEEFFIILPATTLTQAQALAEKIRTTVGAGRIRRRDGAEAAGSVTVSVGVAVQRQGDSAEGWCERADRALYAAKHGGRNRVVVAA